MFRKIPDFLKFTQLHLFPFVEDVIGPLSKRHQRLLAILDLIGIERFITENNGRGRPSKNRAALARAFIAKVVFKLPYTDLTRDCILSDRQLRRICGWENIKQVPSEATFSRAFAEFSQCKLPERAHAALISEVYENELVGHVIIDSTPIEAREKVETVAKVKEAPRKRGRPKKSEKTEKQMTRVERQAVGKLTPAEMLNELPVHCARAMKKKPGLSNYMWKGYKLHLSVDGHGIPLAACVTSAILNDHEAAIPMTLLTEERVNFCYLLGDSAYDVKAVVQKAEDLGHRMIVDPKPYNPAQKLEKEAEQRRRKLLNWAPADRVRYRERKKGERPNALIKEYYGGNNVYYRGYTKVACHLMFGVLTLSARLIMSLG